jgi:hypothetical protein
MLKRLMVILLLSLGGRALTLGQERPDTTNALQRDLDSTVDSYSVDANSALLALIKVATDFRLPMGIEWIKAAGSGVRYIHSWQDTTISAIIRDIVDSQTGYQMDTTGTGLVVHVRPTVFRLDNGDIVNAHIGSFEVRREFVASASRRLERLAGALMVPLERSPVGSGVASSIGTGMDDQKVTIRVEDGSVRDILDHLCLATGLKIWIVAYPALETRTATGFLRTVSLYNDIPIEDRWQPIWTFLPWGHSEPSERGALGGDGWGRAELPAGWRGDLVPVAPASTRRGAMGCRRHFPKACRTYGKGACGTSMARMIR